MPTKEQFQNAVAEVKKTSQKRKFQQSYDLIINLRDVDLSKTDQQVELFVTLPHPTGKVSKICAFVGPELASQAKEVCDLTITQEEFPKLAEDAKAVKKMADECDYFVAQATIMPNVAKTFGRVLGPRGKMPNPKAGCVVPPNANLKPLVERLKRTVRIVAKTQPSIKCLVGKEDMPDEQVVGNIQAVYSQLVAKLPNEEGNVRKVLLKMTMSKPVAVGAKEVKK